MLHWSRFNIKLPEVNRIEQAHSRIDSLAKPPGSLGVLETLGARLAGIQDVPFPKCDQPHVLVFAGDHGVAWQDQVSPYPPQVTAKMVETFVRGTAAVSVLARQAGATLEIVNCGVVGVKTDLKSKIPGISIFHHPARETPCGNIAREPALSVSEQEICFEAGRKAVSRCIGEGKNLVAVGEMGIGNTTSAAALAAKLLKIAAAAVTGPGTGIKGDGLEHKKKVVQAAVDRCPESSPLTVLRELGGFEINAMTACILACAEKRIPVVIDGFISSTAALVATILDPKCRPYLFAATLSTEPGHISVLRNLEIGEPLLQLNLRLGEASGAALALPIFNAACKLMSEMATLAEVLEDPSGN